MRCHQWTRISVSPPSPHVMNERVCVSPTSMHSRGYHRQPVRDVLGQVVPPPSSLSVRGCSHASM